MHSLLGRNNIEYRYIYIIYIYSVLVLRHERTCNKILCCSKWQNVTNNCVKICKDCNFITGCFENVAIDHTLLAPATILCAVFRAPSEPEEAD